MSERVFRTALGISVGDIVATSYGSGPYEVWEIAGPRYTERFPGTLVIRTWPVISLVCVDLGHDPEEPGRHRGYSILSSVRYEGNRWFSDMNDEILVKPRALMAPVQLGLFDPAAEEPYTFQVDVDYTHDAWHCDSCGLDFNVGAAARFDAHHCAAWRPPLQILLMEPRPAPSERDWSAYQVALGFGEQHKWWKKERAS